MLCFIIWIKVLYRIGKGFHWFLARPLIQLFFCFPSLFRLLFWPFFCPFRVNVTSLKEFYSTTSVR